MNILDTYVHTAPNPQLAVDIFKGAWSTTFPPPYAHLNAGTIPHFTDARIPWAHDKLGGFKDRTIVELGPLEAAQTYLIDRHDPAEIVAIEANTTAYLKCLIVKELLCIKHARFLCGDFMSYLRANSRRFDICIASGVLYHMRNPAELIALIARASDRVFLWTHYYDGNIIQKRPDLVVRYSTHGTPAEYGGFKHRLYHHEYQGSLGWTGFCGGPAHYSNWMTRDDILACLRYFGFDELHIGFEGPDHPDGPSFAVAAIRNNPEAVPQFKVEIEDDAIEAQSQSVIIEPKADLSPAIAEIQRQLTEQHTYIKRLEETLTRKNQHIMSLERHIKQIEAGRMMRILKAFKR